MAGKNGKNAVAKADAKDPDLPDFLKGTAEGQEAMDADDLVVPVIKLLQGPSPEVEQMDNAKAGIFWDAGKDAPVPDETTLEFTPLAFRKKVLLMAPMVDGQGILCRASDGKRWDHSGEWKVNLGNNVKVDWKIPVAGDGKAVTVEESGLMKFGSSNPDDPDSPPAATLIYEYLVLPVGETEPVVMSFARTAIKQVKKGLNSKVEAARGRGVAMQGLVFKARIIKEQNSAGQEYYNWAFQQMGYVEDEDHLKFLLNLVPQYKDYKYDEERAARDDNRSADGDDGEDSKEY